MSSLCSPSVAEILRSHVTLELEGLDRLYLNVYVPKLQYPSGVATFLRYHRGAQYASSVVLQPISDAFVATMDAFVTTHQIPVITFRKGQRKDDLAKEALAAFAKAGGTEGVLFVGKAQEKTPVIRTEKRHNPRTGRPYPWLVWSTAMVNHWYWYAVDRDFGPFFLKVCTYFPYTVKVCLNGHEYLKRQLAREAIQFEALDNGLRTCAEPKRAQTLCDRLSAEKIEGLVRKWLRVLPSAFTPADTREGYRYVVSVLQAEFSLTQVLDRPATGRLFFEEVLRENLDLGRPSQVQLIFDRRITRLTPGRFRTRIITEGVTPSLHLDYKHTRIKQYHKDGRALRTETTINDTRDFNIGRRLTRENLAALRVLALRPPTPSRCGTPQLRLRRGRHGVRTTPPTNRGSRPARVGASLWRATGPGAAERADQLSAAAARLLSRRPQDTTRVTRRRGQRRHHHGPYDLRLASPPAARSHHAHPQNTSLSPDGLRPPRGTVLNAELRAGNSPGVCARHAHYRSRGHRASSLLQKLERAMDTWCAAARLAA